MSSSTPDQTLLHHEFLFFAACYVGAAEYPGTEFTAQDFVDTVHDFITNRDYDVCVSRNELKRHLEAGLSIVVERIPGVNLEVGRYDNGEQWFELSIDWILSDNLVDSVTRALFDSSEYTNWHYAQCIRAKMASWGDVIEVHAISDFHIVEYRQTEVEDEQVYFEPFIRGIGTCSLDTLDKAIVYALDTKYKGCGTQAAFRILNMDQERR